MIYYFIDRERMKILENKKGLINERIRRKKYKLLK